MCTNSTSESVTTQKLQYSPPSAPTEPVSLTTTETPRTSPPIMTPTPSSIVPFSPQNLSVEQYRQFQLYQMAIAERIRCSQYPNQMAYSPYQMNPYAPRFALHHLFQNRMFVQEEPKPQHSYIGLIAMGILGAPEQKLVLSDIYQYILDNYPYFRNKGPGWRNSIRHNLSLNDCFIKAGRSANGKGHYWAVHPANVDDFKKGDFRRRKAQRKVRKHMGLSVDDDGTDSPSPPPLSLTPPPLGFVPWPAAPAMYASQGGRKRQFDVASLLAPDEADMLKPATKRLAATEEEDIDVVASEDEKDDGQQKVSVDTQERNNNSPPPWQGFWGRNFMDPRLLGYYGQYVAARRFSMSGTTSTSSVHAEEPE